MAHWEPNNIRQPRLPSLRVDSLRAHRQNNDAVILPITYELTEPNFGLHADSLIVPISWPLRRFTTVITPLEISIGESDRKKKLALLKKKLESPRKRPAAKAKASQATQQIENTSAKSSNPGTESESRIKHLQTTVPLLLLCVIVVVFFVWACFR